MSKHGGLGSWLARLAAGTGLALASLAASAYTQTSGGYNVPTGVTEIAHEVHGLHMAIFWVCVVIGIVVFGAMIYSIIFHRRSNHPKPADFHESTTVEIIWTGLPFVILIAIAVPAAATLIKMEDTRNSDLSIKVTGFQWKWHYDYLGENVAYFSTLTPELNAARQLKSGVDVTTVPNYLVDVDHPLVVPVGKKIRFLVTSNDVIHAWWVPEIAAKKDAIPGYVNEIWTRIEQPGTYRGVCAELCGRDHGYMPIVVKALPEAEYQAWLAKAKTGEVAAAAPVTQADVPADAAPPAPAATPAVQEVAAAAAPAAVTPSKDELMKQGEKVYTANCMACHQANGAGLPPSFPPLAGSKVANGPAKDHVSQVIKGKPGGGGVMPPFAQLSDADVAAVVTYERASWGNSGSVVLPADVAAARK